MIALDQQDLQRIDEEFWADSQIWQPLAGGAKSITAADFSGVKTVRVNKMSGFVDAEQYKRNGDNAHHNINVEKESFELTHEDWIGYDLEQLDMSENGAYQVANAIRLHNQRITVPHRDKFAAQTLYDTAKNGGKLVTDTIDKKNALDAYDDLEEYMTDNEIPGGYVIFASAGYYRALKNADGVNKSFSREGESAMKRDLLKEHGFSEEQINFVMAENGKDVNSLKEQINNLTGERDGLQKQIDDRDKQLNTLKKSAKDNEELQSQIKQLQDENKTAKQNYQDQLAKQNKSFKIEGALRDAKAKNIKTVLPLIDTEKVSVNDDGTLNGLSEQLDNIKQDNGFLFGEENKTPRVEIKNGFQDGNNKNTSDTIVSHIAERFANSNE